MSGRFDGRAPERPKPPPPTLVGASPTTDAAQRAWADQFARAAGLTLGDGPTGDGPGVLPSQEALGAFRDEAGHRRRVDGPFLSFCWGLEGEGADSAAAAGPDSGDVRLWRVLAQWRRPGVGSLPAGVPAEAPGDGPAPLLAESAAGGVIETSTEAQLSALHAWWWLGGGLSGEPAAAWRRRLERAAAWFIEHLQPDNATQHPWAAHVFAAVSLTGGVRSGGVTIDADDARLYAQTLLHNAMIPRGRPDRFSAWILWDAARALR